MRRLCIMEYEMIKERLTVVTRKGQITIPVEFRRELGIREGDRVALVIDDGNMRLHRRGSIVERTAGMFKSPRRAATARGLRETAEQAFADEASDRARPQ
jgi:AbrB family looped-hinge helix DNA binding protein